MVHPSFLYYFHSYQQLFTPDVSQVLCTPDPYNPSTYRLQPLYGTFRTHRQADFCGSTQPHEGLDIGSLGIGLFWVLYRLVRALYVTLFTLQAVRCLMSTNHTCMFSEAHLKMIRYYENFLKKKTDQQLIFTCN